MFSNCSKNLLTLTVLLATTSAYSSDAYFSQNNAYTQAIMETYKLEAAARVEEVKLREDLGDAQSSYNSASNELSRATNQISSIDSDLSSLNYREQAIDREIVSLQDSMESVRRSASWELGLSNPNQMTLRRYAQDKRDEARELERIEDRLNREIYDKVNSAPYSQWADRKNSLAREKNQTVQELREKRQRLDQVSSKINQLKSKIDQLQKQIDNLESKLPKLQEQKNAAEQEVKDAQKAFDECKDKCGPQKRTLQLAKAKLSNLEKSINQAQNTIAQNKAEVRQSQQQIQNLREQKQSLPGEINQLEREVARLDSQIDEVSDKMVQFHRNQIQPLEYRRDRVRDDQRDATNKAYRAESFASSLEDKRRDIANLDNERDRIPARRDAYLYERAQLVQSLPPLQENKRIAKNQLDVEQDRLDAFMAQQVKNWVALREARALNDKALADARATQPVTTSDFGMMSALSSATDSYKDWVFVSSQLDVESGATLCLAETTAATGEVLQVMKVKDETSSLFTRPMVRIVLKPSEGAEGNSIAVAGVISATSISDTMRRFEMNNSYRSHNALILAFEDTKEVVSAIRRLSSIQVQAESLEGAKQAPVKFSLSGSMKMVDQMLSECR